MKICAAQLKPRAGDFEYNLRKHIELVEKAIDQGIDLVLFPELSLTSYEPSLAKALSTLAQDPRLNTLQAMSDKSNIIICVGMPTSDKDGVRISLLIFQPRFPRQVYAKQILHEDELPFFVSGKKQLFISHDDLLLAPAICYESMQDSHSEFADEQGAKVYLASVAKSKDGVERGYKHYPNVAEKHGMTVLMANSYGPSDDFVSYGSSAVWNKRGDCVSSLGEAGEGLVGIDTETGEGILIEFSE